MKLDWLSGKLSWTPSNDQEGTHAVEIEVDDLAGGKVSQTFEIQVGFEKPEPAPAAPGALSTRAAPEPQPPPTVRKRATSRARPPAEGPQPGR